MLKVLSHGCHYLNRINNFPLLPISSYVVPTFAYFCPLFPTKCSFHCGINIVRSSGDVYLHNLIVFLL